MMKLRISMTIMLAVFGILIWGCGDFLGEKPFNTSAHPSQLKDLRALLDNETTLTSAYPGHGELASDDFYTGPDGFAYMLPAMQDAFIWEDKGLDGDSWRAAYNIITVANVILESLERIEGGDTKLREQLEGEARFLRGWMFFNLAQIYCAPYSVLQQENNLGLPLRLDSDVQLNLQRSTLKETYELIFTDLDRAAKLMAAKSEYITRPSKQVALAALARAYLTIEEYAKAEEMVDKVMKIESTLLDFNTLDRTATRPFNIANNTELFNLAKSNTVAYLITHASTSVSRELYDLYDDTDIRKYIFFEEDESGVRFKGFYHGDRSAFYGFAQDEMYLIKAECAARRGKVSEGADYLNALLEKRYLEGQFTPLIFAESRPLLDKILEERRKELIFRGVRWLDLRRLNRYPEYATTLHREVGAGNSYSIGPGDLRYTFLIPLDAIDLGGYTQNPR